MSAPHGRSPSEPDEIAELPKTSASLPPARTHTPKQGVRDAEVSRNGASDLGHIPKEKKRSNTRRPIEPRDGVFATVASHAKMMSSHPARLIARLAGATYVGSDAVDGAGRLYADYALQGGATIAVALHATETMVGEVGGDAI